MKPEDLESKITARFPKVEKAKVPVRGYATLRVTNADELVAVVTWLKGDLGFGYLDMVTAVDWKGPVNLDGYIREPNTNVFLPDGATPQIEPVKPNPAVEYRDVIELVYCLSNFEHRIKVFLKLDVPRDGASAPSLNGLFRAADWQEREVFDLLGVRFEGHPNMQKILTPDFIQGHPLRKDYVHKKDRFD